MNKGRVSRRTRRGHDLYAFEVDCLSNIFAFRKFRACCRTWSRPCGWIGTSRSTLLRTLLASMERSRGGVKPRREPDPALARVWIGTVVKTSGPRLNVSFVGYFSVPSHEIHQGRLLPHTLDIYKRFLAKDDELIRNTYDPCHEFDTSIMSASSPCRKAAITKQPPEDHRQSFSQSWN